MNRNTYLSYVDCFKETTEFIYDSKNEETIQLG